MLSGDVNKTVREFTASCFGEILRLFVTRRTSSLRLIHLATTFFFFFILHAIPTLLHTYYFTNVRNGMHLAAVMGTICPLSTHPPY